MSNLRSATLKGYLEAVNDLFTSRKFDKPTDFTCPRNKPGTIVKNLEKEEDIANRRSPLTDKMIAEMVKASEANNFDSFEAAIADWTLLGIYTGNRLAEYGQKTQTKVDLHVYPSGRSVIKAFTGEDFRFYDRHNNIINDPIRDQHKVHKLVVRWRIQKNRRNGEENTYIIDNKNPKLCPVLAAIRIVRRAQLLQQPATLPLALFSKKGLVKYITGSKISAYYASVARKVHPTMPEEEIKRFTPHSIRVTAAVLLSQAGKKAHYIKIRLRWLGDSYQLYLRNTDGIASQHTDSVNTAMEAIKSLSIANLPENVAHIVPEDTEMGAYEDIE